MNIAHPLVAAFLSVMAAGCATSGVGVDAMQQAGSLRIDVADGAGYDYRVSLDNGRDIGFDGDNPNDRARVAGLALARECKAVEVLSETPIKKSVGAFGFERITYVMRVKCQRA